MAAECFGGDQRHDTRAGAEMGGSTFREFLELPKLSSVEDLRLFLYLVVLGDPCPELCSGG